MIWKKNWPCNNHFYLNSILDYILWKDEIIIYEVNKQFQNQITALKIVTFRAFFDLIWKMNFHRFGVGCRRKVISRVFVQFLIISLVFLQLFIISRMVIHLLIILEIFLQLVKIVRVFVWLLKILRAFV